MDCTFTTVPCCDRKDGWIGTLADADYESMTTVNERGADLVKNGAVCTL